MEAIPLLDIQSSSPSIFYIQEDPTESYRVSEKAFSTENHPNLEHSIRQLCEQLHIPPLSSYLMSVCTFPNESDGNRRWFPMGDRAFQSSELRLCCRHFNPRQLGFLSEDLLKYHFLTVKYDLLRKHRIQVKNMDHEGLHNFISTLLTIDICRVLCMIRDEGTMDNFETNPDLLISMVQKYDDFLLHSTDRFARVKQFHKTLFWKRSPQKQLQQLKLKIQGKHWSDFVIYYLETVEKSCPSLRANRYDLYGHRSIELGADGLTRIATEEHPICNVSSLVYASFRSPQVIELIISDQDSQHLIFENETDARSFAAELTCYSGVLRYSSRPIFEQIDSSITLPSQRFHLSQCCWGPLNPSDDLHALYQASALLGSDTECNAIAFENSTCHDLIGVLVVHRESRRESVRWYLKRTSQENGPRFQDLQAGSEYSNLENAATAQLSGLMHLHAEADQTVQPMLLFDATAVLPPFQLFNRDTATSSISNRIDWPPHTFIRGRFNTTGITRMGQEQVALKYVRIPHRASMDALDQSQAFASSLKRHLSQNEDASQVFRQFLFSIDRDTWRYPRCLVLEYCQESLEKCLLENGMRYSLAHLLQACLDLADAVFWLDTFGMVHGEISCKKLFISRKPDLNGSGELRVKLAEPSFHQGSDEAIAPDQDDLFKLGSTIQEIFFLSTPSPQLRASNQAFLAINFRSFFDNPNRYPPILARDQFQMMADHVQRMVLSLTTPGNLRVPASEIRLELGTLLNQLSMIRYQEPDYDYNQVMADQRIYGVELKDLRPSEKLGEGNFGVVWKVQHVDNSEILALKVLKIQNYQNNRMVIREMTENLREELNMHISLSHPNVVQLRGIQYDRHGLITGILMEFHPNGSLSHYLRTHRSLPDRPNEDQKLKWALQIAKGMAHLHQKGIVHRDLAARNILLDANLTAKVSDFGFACSGPCSPRDEYPAAWWPPEWRNLNGADYEHLIFEKSGDVYSYGVLIWEIDNDGNSQPKFYEPSHDDGRSLMVMNENGSRVLIGLIEMCTLRAPAWRRPTFEWLVAKISEGLQ